MPAEKKTLPCARVLRLRTWGTRVAVVRCRAEDRASGPLVAIAVAEPLRRVTGSADFIRAVVQYRRMPAALRATWSTTGFPATAGEVSALAEVVNASHPPATAN